LLLVKTANHGNIAIQGDLVKAHAPELRLTRRRR
jgi:hypothetical protein